MLKIKTIMLEFLKFTQKHFLQQLMTHGKLLKIHILMRNQKSFNHAMHTPKDYQKK